MRYIYKEISVIFLFKTARGPIRESIHILKRDKGKMSFAMFLKKKIFLMLSVQNGSVIENIVIPKTQLSSVNARSV